ncbi:MULTISPECIES: Yip1 family protein [Streptomyces]|uniref:Yip1 family protein n=1 Tax=Streptomyces TaxID=1883 RepID=UPI00340FFAEC
MSQLGRKDRPVHPGPAPRALRSGYVRSVAGFRMGRGRDAHGTRPAQQGQRPGQQAPYGAPGGMPGGGTGAPGGQQWQQHGGHGEPEYFGGGGGQQGGPYGQYDPYGRQAPQDPYYGQQAPQPGPTADHPGHTQQFSVGEADAYGRQAPYSPYGDDGYGDGSYDNGSYDDGATYRAGQAPAPPVGPRLHWKELLTGIVLRPSATFWQMRDHAMWAPALIVTFVYGLLAVFGFDKARADVLNATLSNSIPWVLITGVVVVVSGMILGAVTHTLARQLGGDGEWQPTIGLSMLLMSITDAPRLLFAMFLGGDSPFVQVVGWATWLVAGALFTSMVSKSHDLPWPKALGASAIQLIALLSIIKLGTL